MQNIVIITLKIHYPDIANMTPCPNKILGKKDTYVCTAHIHIPKVFASLLSGNSVIWLDDGWPDGGQLAG